MFLINPEYRWAHKVIALQALLALLSLYTNYSYSVASGLLRGRVGESAPELVKLSMLGFISNISYIIMLMGALAVLGRPVTEDDLTKALLAWSLSGIISKIFALMLVVFSRYLSGDFRKALGRVALRNLLLVVLSIIVSYLIRPRGPPSTSFFKELRVIGFPLFTELLVVYVLLLVLDRDLRDIVKEAIKRAREFTVPYFRS